MNRLRQHIRNYFGFSKTETNGFLLLVPFMLLVLFIPTLYSELFSQEYDPEAGDRQMLDSIMVAWSDNIEEPVKKAVEVPMEIVLTAFDPNTATKEQLEGLGVPKILAGRIDRYREKGGQFRVKSDLAKIYDFPDSLYQVLTPYIQLPDKLERKKPRYRPKDTSPEVKEAVPIEEEIEEVPLLVDINSADTTALKQLRGIGSGYSRRIIKYRELLGGYSSVAQIAEVYGITDSLYQSISAHLVLGEPKFNQVNVNIANFKTLNRHPYISYKQAGAILNTRSKKGKFRSLQDLMVVEGMDSVKLQRLKPYITF